MKNILIIAPHADDETLGCGGTILRHIAEGDMVYWLLVTEISEVSGHCEVDICRRQQELKSVMECYSFSKLFQLKLSPAGVDELSIGDLVEKLSDVIKTVRPQTIYLPFKGDIHTDHKCVFDAALSCTKSFRYPFIKRILCYETISETDFGIDPTEKRFDPNVFVNITDYMEKKICIMKLYANEIDQHPFPRSIEGIRALAMIRGAASGCQYAESFMLLKEMVL